MKSVLRLADIVTCRTALAAAAADDSINRAAPIETTLADLAIEVVR